ncbi:MAG: hypothetical protein AABZ14_07625 [Candidatus Margulisiibacteriota bacterium]
MPPFRRHILRYYNRHTKHAINQVLPAVEELFRSFDVKDSRIVISNNPNMQININMAHGENISIVNTVSEKSILKELTDFKKDIDQTNISSENKNKLNSEIDALIDAVHTKKDKSLISGLYSSIKKIILDSLTGSISKVLVDQLNKMLHHINILFVLCIIFIGSMK